MEAKSPFEEIFSSKKEKKEEEKKEEDLLDFNASESGDVPLDTGDRYLNLIVELLKNKYFFEAIEVIKEMAGEGI